MVEMMMATNTKATKKTAASKAAKPAAKTKKTPDAETKFPAAGKLSQIAAAERVLAESNDPMTCKAIVVAMSAKGYRSSLGQRVSTMRSQGPAPKAATLSSS